MSVLTLNGVIPIEASELAVGTQGKQEAVVGENNSTGETMDEDVPQGEMLTEEETAEVVITEESTTEEVVTEEETTEEVVTEEETTERVATEEEITEEVVTEEETTEEATTEEMNMRIMAFNMSDTAITYAFDDINVADSQWGTANMTENEDGSISFVFPELYDQVNFMIPEGIDVSHLDKVLVNTDGNIENLAIKLYAEDFSAEAAVAYGINEVSTDSINQEKITLSDLTAFSIMGLEAGYEITIDSVTFTFSEDANADVGTEENIFNFDEFEEVMAYGLEKSITDEGALEITYTQEYGEVRYKIPESVDVTKLNRIVLNMASGDTSGLSLKLLANYDPVEELDAKYGVSSISTDNVSDRSMIKYFGIMGMSSAVDVPYEISSVTFEMDEGKEPVVVNIQTDIPNLRDAIAEKTDSNFIVGACLENNVYGELSDEYVMALVKKHFNAITPGNELKPDCLFGYNSTCSETDSIVWNGEEFIVPVLDYSKAEKMLDAILEWNNSNPSEKIRVRGHVLVWHSQTPEWFFHEDYDADKAYVDAATMTKRQEWYIKSVLEHFTGKDSKYKDLFYGWDVVNEAVSDSTGTYRNGSENSSWWNVYGSNEFIINAFRFANKYAPADLELYYNDYNECVSSKVSGIVQLLTDVKNADGTRIDGMGMQAHYQTEGSPAVADFKKAVRAYAEVVGNVQLTELDFKATNNYDGTSATQDSEYTKLAYRYKDIYDAIIELREEGINMTGMTIWGVVDKNSWLQTSNSVGGASDGTQKQCPLLFDDNYQAKPAYWALVDATRLQPEIKRFDITHAIDESYTAGTSIELCDGNAQMTVVPVWDEKGIHILAHVQDATVDSTDSVMVYTSIDGQIVKKVVSRQEGIATSSGYDVEMDIACNSSELYVTADILMDFVLTNGEEQTAYNDITMNQENSDEYYAVAVLKPYVRIPQGTAIVDGTMEKAWGRATTIPMTIDLGTNTEAMAKLMWDENYLYLYADVTDPVLNSDSANAHEKDSVEIFIDENNHKSTSYEEDDKQYRVNYLNEHSFNGTKCLEENMQSAVIVTEYGYKVEAAFAWTDIEPTVGAEIGLELQINDADESGSRKGTLSWYDASGLGWSKPEVFGTAMLTDEYEAMDEKEDKPTQKVDREKDEKKTEKKEYAEPKEKQKGNKSNKKEEFKILDKLGDFESQLILFDEENGNRASCNISLYGTDGVLTVTDLIKLKEQKVILYAFLNEKMAVSIDPDSYTAQKNLYLNAVIDTEIDYGQGFLAVTCMPNYPTQLEGEITLHLNLGAEHKGKIAYLFAKDMVTGMLECKQATEIDSIGNVEYKTNVYGDIVILYQ